MAKLEAYKEVALTEDIPAENLRQGDVATLVDRVPHPSGGEEGAVLELFQRRWGICCGCRRPFVSRGPAATKPNARRSAHADTLSITNLCFL
jgi:hypothetical protein